MCVCVCVCAHVWEYVHVYEPFHLYDTIVWSYACERSAILKRDYLGPHLRIFSKSNHCGSRLILINPLYATTGAAFSAHSLTTRGKKHIYIYIRSFKDENTVLPLQKIAAKRANDIKDGCGLYWMKAEGSERIRSGDQQYNTVPLCETLNILGPAEINFSAELIFD